MRRAGAAQGGIQRCWWLIAAIAWLALFSRAAAAATSVSGAILSDTIWRAQDSPFEAVGNVVITGGATLTIEAGVTVYLRGGVDLTVEQGALRVMGQTGAPVVLTSSHDRPGDSPMAGDWGRLRFLDGTIDSATLIQGAEIRYGSGITLEACGPTFNNVAIIGHAAPAMTIDLRSSPAGAGNRADGNQLNGILVPAGDILDKVSWTLRGIPFVIQQGTLGVGAPPVITSVEPSSVEQGATADITLRGTRLAGAESILFDDARIQGVVLSGGGDTSIPVRVTVPGNVPLQTVGVQAQVAAGKVRRDNALSIVVPLPPIVATGVIPASIRRGETRPFTVTGSGMLGAQVTSSDSGLSITNLQTTAAQATFSLTASSAALLGTAVLSVTNPGVAKGVASVGVTVQKVLPRIQVLPALIAVPPDGPSGAPRSFQILLTDTDDVDRKFTITSADASLAQIAPLAFTIPAGQTRAIVTILGLKLGHTSLTVAAEGLSSLSVPLLVTPDFSGINTSYAQPLGVVLQSASQNNTRSIGPVASRGLAVVVGAYLRAVSPATLEVGSGPLPLVITGAGFAPSATVSIAPSDGLTLGNAVVAADGTSVTVPVSVAPGAPTTPRRVVVTAPSGRYPVATPGADRILVTPPRPVIDAIDPINVIRGASVSLTVYGRNLQSATAVSVLPADGVVVGLPSSNTAGTVVTAPLVISAGAALGAHVVTVTTPGGSSSSIASVANTLTIGQTVQAIRTPIASRPLGVLIPTPQSTASRSAYSRALGVSLGSVVTLRSPAAGIVDTSLTLTVRGSGLFGVTSVQLQPADGIVLGNVSAALDGTQVTVPLMIAADAPQVVRKLRVLSGASIVPFADPAQAQFLVTAPLPRVDSLTPNVLQIGAAAVSLTVRGANFQNAQSVRVVPPDGLAISPPTVDATGTQVTVNVSAAANATPGPRTVVVTTPAGASAASTLPANTLLLATTIKQTISPIAAPRVGVVLQDAAPPSTLSRLVASRVLGVTVQTGQTQTTITRSTVSPPLGTVIGPYASGIVPAGIVAGASGTLTILGAGLSTAMHVEIVPANDITVGGTVSVNGTGTELSVPITVAATATAVTRHVLLKQGSTVVPFAGSGADRLAIGSGVPEITSIEPLRATQGQTVTGFIIRGRNFTGATAVSAEPANGVRISPRLTISAAGDQITVDLAVDASASVGTRVIRVAVPGAQSTGVGSPANRFTVDAK